MLKRIRLLFRIPGYPLYMICMMLMGMAISISSPFLAVYFTTKLEVSAATFGVFTAVTLLSGVWLSSAVARRSDSGLSRKKIMAAALICNAIAFSGYLFIHEFYALLVFMTVFTALGTPAMPQLFASSREAVNASGTADHGFANSTLRSMFSLGFILGPLIGSVLIAQFGFRGIFAGTVAIFVFCAVLISVFMKQPAAAPASTAARPAPPMRLHQDARVLLPFLVVAFLYTGHWMNNLNISLFVTGSLGGNTGDVATVASICALLEIPIMLALGGLSAKFSGQKLMLSGIVVGGVYYLVVLFASQMWQVLAGQVLLAFFVAVISTVGISYIQDLLPDQPGYASTLYTNGSTLGRLAGNLAGGLAAGWFGNRGAYVGCLLFACAAFALMALPQRGLAASPGDS
ncbi:sugar efflux transporter [Paenibacillus sp. NFR01]|uniref:sugar efflux transporter n=1 Tax=Paenibacillus sp. NFR01 TaxID=1566279 RepID=UPI000B829FCB|nr:sugar efflux transporter [Paenibacillus sp. NFR01]